MLEKVEEFQPELMLVLKGETLRGDIINQVRAKGVLTANWFMDTIISPYYRRWVEEISAFYDFFFIIDSLAAKKVVNISSKKVFFLPTGFDADTFRPLDLEESDRQYYGSPLTFVGTIVNKRIPVLEELADLGLSIWGPDRSVEGKWLTKSQKLARGYRGRSVYGQEAVKVYNASGIVFSVHSQFPEPVYNVTPRLFEAAACRAFHLVDYNPQIEDFYRLDEEIICYKTIREARKLTEYYLSHKEEREAIAERAYKRARREHSYDQRIEKLLSLAAKVRN